MRALPMKPLCSCVASLAFTSAHSWSALLTLTCTTTTPWVHAQPTSLLGSGSSSTANFPRVGEDDGVVPTRHGELLNSSALSA